MGSEVGRGEPSVEEPTSEVGRCEPSVKEPTEKKEEPAGEGKPPPLPPRYPAI
jgi:hypothetical protein